MLTAAGAKLLDFGLAKLAEKAPASKPETAKGATGDSTIPGTILGTMPYMAPEQLEGREAGPRTDIFAFGAVLYEMVTGKRAFDGRSQALLIAAIVSADPEPLSGIQPQAPPALDFVVRQCLAKDPDERVQTAWDLLCQLRWIQEGGGKAVAPRAASRKRERLMIVALAVVLAVAALLARPALRYLSASETSPQFRFLVNVPDMPLPEAVAISPDGQSLAYAARDSGSTALFLRPIDTLTPKRLAGTEGAGRFFWSADSQSLAFFAAGQLKRVDVSAGATHNICETPDLLGGSWNPDNVILFASSKGLQRVPAAGGQPVPVPSSEKEGGRREPFFLPDGRHYLYLSGSAGKDAAIYAGELDSMDSHRVVDANSNPVYIEPGFLLYHRSGTLYAQPLSARSQTTSGEPIRIADKIPFSDNGAGAFSASSAGVLIYRNAPPAPASSSGATASDVLAVPLVWVDLSGKTVQRLGEEAGWLGVDLSPDGKRVAVHRHESAGGDVWIFEPGLANPTKFTFDAAQDNSSPLWSPNGKIAFGSRRNGKWGLYLKAADNTASETLLQESASPIVPMSWSPDGKVLVYITSDARTGSDIWRLTPAGEKPAAAPFLQTAADERHPQLSPDGRWIAYSSNTSGRSEIYIRPFPEGPGLIQVSVNGGVFPRWRADGKQLYFISVVSLGAMMAADLNVRGAEISKTADPRPLFQTGFLDSTHTGGYSHAYAVAGNGQRFLLPQVEEVERGIRGSRGATLVPRALATAYSDRHATLSTADRSMAPINVVLNWTTSLKK